jgi:hypothetical protein
MTRKRPLSLMLGCGLALAGAAARADVTTDSLIAIDGVGIMSVVGLSGRVVQTIAGDRMREDSELKFNSKLIGFFARSATGPHAEIVRLDQDKIYNIDVNKKQYTEVSLEERRARLNAVTQKTGEQPAAAKQQPAAFDDSKCEWSPPRTVVTKGAKATIAGIEAQQVKITSTQTCTDRKSGESCDLALILDSWLTPSVPGGDERQKFTHAYAEKLGLSAAGSREVMDRAKPLFSRYDGSWKEVQGKLKDVKGVALRASFGLAIGGANCQKANEQQQAGGGLPPSSPTAGEIGGQIASSEVQQQTGGALGGAAGAIGGKLVSSLFNHKKKDDSAAAAAPSPAPPSGAGAGAGAGTMIDIVRISSQITAINTNAAPAGAFEPPAGFKKVEEKD